MKKINPFNDIKNKLLGVEFTEVKRSDTENFPAIGVGTGSNVMHCDESGFWLGAAKYADAPFKVDMDGNATCSSIVLTGYLADGEAAADVNANATTVNAAKILLSVGNTLDGWQAGGDVTKIDGGEIYTNTVALSSLAFVPLTSSGTTAQVIATINASTEGINITADRIAISGDCTFTAGYDPTGKIATSGAAADVNANATTISGGKITTQSMNWAVGHGGTLTLGGSGNGSGVFRLNNSGGTQIVGISNVGIDVKSGGNIFVRQGGDFLLYEGTTSNAGIFHFVDSSNVSKYRIIYLTTDDLVFGPSAVAGGDMYLGYGGAGVGKYSENVYLAATSEIALTVGSGLLTVDTGGVDIYGQGSNFSDLGDGTNNIKMAAGIISLTGTQGNFNVAHGGSSKPDHVLVQPCGGTNSATIIGTWDYDNSDSTNVEVWWDSDTSFSSTSIRFHFIFFWF